MGKRIGSGIGSGRVTLQKHHSSHDRDKGLLLGGSEGDRERDRERDKERDGGKGAGGMRSKRFSKRQSKGVLAAVF